MPVYTFRCESCGVQFDQYLKFTDEQPTRCPECGKKALKKVFQPVGIVFKGSGFYATDHHSPSGQRPMGSSSEEKAASEKKSEAGEKKESKESGAEAKESKSDKPEKKADSE